MQPRKMKPLRWSTNHEDAEYMRLRRQENLARSLQNPHENWMAAILEGTGRKWSRQAIWGHRIFDFWCHELGAAVEVDGASHRINYDNYRDEYNYRRSGVVVLRVPNGCAESAEQALAVIRSLEPWKERRLKLGIFGSKKQKRNLVLP